MDTSAECLVQKATSEVPVNLITIEECIKAIQSGYRLVFILRGYSRGQERVMDSYLQPAELYKYLETKDILMWPVRNSAFLRITSIDGNSLYAYIKRAALRHHVELKEHTKMNAIRTLIGMGDMLYVEAKR